MAKRDVKRVGGWTYYRERLCGLGVWRCASPDDDAEVRVRLVPGTIDHDEELIVETDAYEMSRCVIVPLVVIDRLREFAKRETNGSTKP